LQFATLKSFGAGVLTSSRKSAGEKTVKFSAFFPLNNRNPLSARGLRAQTIGDPDPDLAEGDFIKNEKPMHFIFFTYLPQ
jgi:hypothetical protein